MLFHEPLLAPGEWGLWRIAEPEQELSRHLSLYPEEVAELNAIRGEARRREYLAARLLLHHMSGRRKRGELIKDHCGKPHLQDSLFFVSISHTRGLSAAIAQPRPCGIDVQRIVPHIRKLARKFVSVEESLHLVAGQELVQLHLIWAAKEAMYKAYGLRELDFRHHLRVDLSAYHPAATEATATLRKEGVAMHFHLEFRTYPEYVLVAAVER